MASAYFTCEISASSLRTALKAHAIFTVPLVYIDRHKDLFAYVRPVAKGQN